MEPLFTQTPELSKVPGFLPQQGVYTSLKDLVMSVTSDDSEPALLPSLPTLREADFQMEPATSPGHNSNPCSGSDSDEQIVQQIGENPNIVGLLAAAVRAPSTANGLKSMKRKKFRPKDKLDLLHQQLQNVTNQFTKLQIHNQELRLKKHVLEIINESTTSYENLAAQTARDIAEHDRDPTQPPQGAARYRDISAEELAEVYSHSIAQYSKWVANADEGRLTPDNVEELRNLTMDTINTTRYAVIICPHIILHVNRRLRKMSQIKAPSEEQHLLYAIEAMQLREEQEEVLLMGHRIFGRCVDNLNSQWQNLVNNIGQTIVGSDTLEAQGMKGSEHSLLSQLMATRLRQMAGLQLVICTFMYEKVFDTMQTVRLFLHAHPLLPRCVWDVLSIMRNHIESKRGQKAPPMVPVNWTMQEVAGSTIDARSLPRTTSSKTNGRGSEDTTKSHSPIRSATTTGSNCRQSNQSNTPDLSGSGGANFADRGSEGTPQDNDNNQQALDQLSVGEDQLMSPQMAGGDLAPVPHAPQPQQAGLRQRVAAQAAARNPRAPLQTLAATPLEAAPKSKTPNRQRRNNNNNNNNAGGPPARQVQSRQQPLVKHEPREQKKPGLVLTLPTVFSGINTIHSARAPQVAPPATAPPPPSAPGTGSMGDSAPQSAPAIYSKPNLPTLTPAHSYTFPTPTEPHHVLSAPPTGPQPPTMPPANPNIVPHAPEPHFHRLPLPVKRKASPFPNDKPSPYHPSPSNPMFASQPPSQPPHLQADTQFCDQAYPFTQATQPAYQAPNPQQAFHCPPLKKPVSCQSWPAHSEPNEAHFNETQLPDNSDLPSQKSDDFFRSLLLEPLEQDNSPPAQQPLQQQQQQQQQQQSHQQQQQQHHQQQSHQQQQQQQPQQQQRPFNRRVSPFDPKHPNRTHPTHTQFPPSTPSQPFPSPSIASTRGLRSMSSAQESEIDLNDSLTHSSAIYSSQTHHTLPSPTSSDFSMQRQPGRHPIPRSHHSTPIPTHPAPLLHTFSDTLRHVISPDRIPHHLREASLYRTAAPSDFETLTRRRSATAPATRRHSQSHPAAAVAASVAPHFRPQPRPQQQFQQQQQQQQQQLQQRRSIDHLTVEPSLSLGGGMTATSGGQNLPPFDSFPLELDEKLEAEVEVLQAQLPQQPTFYPTVQQPAAQSFGSHQSQPSSMPPSMPPLAAPPQHLSITGAFAPTSNPTTNPTNPNLSSVNPRASRGTAAGMPVQRVQHLSPYDPARKRRVRVATDPTATAPNPSSDPLRNAPSRFPTTTTHTAPPHQQRAAYHPHTHADPIDARSANTLRPADFATHAPPPTGRAQYTRYPPASSSAAPQQSPHNSLHPPTSTTHHRAPPGADAIRSISPCELEISNPNEISLTQYAHRTLLSDDLTANLQQNHDPLLEMIAMSEHPMHGTGFAFSADSCFANGLSTGRISPTNADQDSYDPLHALVNMLPSSVPVIHSNNDFVPLPDSLPAGGFVSTRSSSSHIGFEYTTYNANFPYDLPANPNHGSSPHLSPASPNSNSRQQFQEYNHPYNPNPRPCDSNSMPSRSSSGSIPFSHNPPSPQSFTNNPYSNAPRPSHTSHTAFNPAPYPADAPAGAATTAIDYQTPVPPPHYPTMPHRHSSNQHHIPNQPHSPPNYIHHHVSNGTRADTHHNQNQNQAHDTAPPAPLLEEFQSQTKLLLSQHPGAVTLTNLPSSECTSEPLSNLFDDICPSDSDTIADLNGGTSDAHTSRLPSLPSGGWLLHSLDNCLPA